MQHKTVAKPYTHPTDDSHLKPRVKSSEVIEYINFQRSFESHGCETPRQEKRQAQAENATFPQAEKNERHPRPLFRFVGVVYRCREDAHRCTTTNRS